MMDNVGIPIITRCMHGACFGMIWNHPNIILLGVGSPQGSCRTCLWPVWPRLTKDLIIGGTWYSHSCGYFSAFYARKKRASKIFFNNAQPFSDVVEFQNWDLRGQLTGICVFIRLCCQLSLGKLWSRFDLVAAGHPSWLQLDAAHLAGMKFFHINPALSSSGFNQST